MHIALPADGGGVAQLVCHDFDSLDDVLLRLSRGVRESCILERRQGQDGPGPGAKILGGKVVTADTAQILVHLRGIYLAALAIFIEVLKQLVPRYILAALDNPRQPEIGDLDGMLFPTPPRN